MRVPLDKLLGEIEQEKNNELKAEIRRIVPHFAGFTFRDYEQILKELARKYAIVPFRDYRKSSGPRLILRHDIEAFVEPALQMAKVEQKLGISSTYFVLLSSRLYNPSEKTSFETLTEISRMGHEIGLHYDVSMYAECGRPPRETLDIELRLLGHLLGNEVRAISRHNPSIQSFPDPFVHMRELMNAYDVEFTEDAHYVSDSCRAWYLEDLLYLLLRNPGKVQLLIHPDSWTATRCGSDQMLAMRFRQLGKEDRRDETLWKDEWKTSERVARYGKSLEVVRKRLL